MRHILSLLLENEAGALSSVSGLFSARAFNIESLTVAVTEDPSISRMTIVTVGSDEIIEQITKQLNKLVDVMPFIISAVERSKNEEAKAPNTQIHMVALFIYICIKKVKNPHIKCIPQSMVVHLTCNSHFPR